MSRATGVKRACKTISKSQVKNVPRFRQEVVIFHNRDGRVMVSDIYYEDGRPS